jgi:hypothetical protein
VKTLSVDKYQRVRLPDVKGGQKFAYENKGNGVLTLTEVKPLEERPMKARLKKRGRYTVVVTDRPVDESVIKQMLSDFP